MTKIAQLSCASVMLFLCYTGNAHATTFPASGIRLPALEIHLTAYVSNGPIDFGSLSWSEQHLMYLDSLDNYSWQEYRYYSNPIAMPGDHITYFIVAGNTGGLPYWPNARANDVIVAFQNDPVLTLNAWWYWLHGRYIWPPPRNGRFGPDSAVWQTDRLDEWMEIWLVISSSIDPDYDQNTIVTSAMVLSIDREEYFEDNYTMCEISIVPEPATILLMGSGLVGLVGFRRRFRRE